jgi:serine O-acetyltransferase
MSMAPGKFDDPYAPDDFSEEPITDLARAVRTQRMTRIPLPAEDRDYFGGVAQSLLDSYRTETAALQHINSYELPSMEAVAEVVEKCRSLLFPGFIGRSLTHADDDELRKFVRNRVATLATTLRVQVYRGVHHKAEQGRAPTDLECAHCANRAEEITQGFVAGLPEIRRLLALDVAAFFAGDPAASGTDEIIFCYPGLFAVTVYRIAHHLHSLGAGLIPRMMTELAHERVGIDIHPGSTIGPSFFIDHGTGVVIGETTVIGEGVRIYQGVTLGALSVPGRNTTGKRHPTLEDGVIVYSGATILGGDTVIGKGAVIGGNCWVTSSVAAGAVVTQGGRRRDIRTDRETP